MEATERLSTCLDRLMPHVRRSDLAVAGGVAIQVRLAAAGQAGWRTGIADLDAIARSVDAIHPSVCEAFLVSHYHVAQPGVPKFMVQLVDPVSTLRVDVFPDPVGSLARATGMQIETQHLLVLALEDILEHKLQTLSKASAAKPVDPKHAHDAYALSRVLGRPAPAVASDCLVKDVYGDETDIYCERCQLSLDPRFPLAPKSDIFRLLGWKPPSGFRTGRNWDSVVA